MHPVEVASSQMPSQEAPARPRGGAEKIINAGSRCSKNAGENAKTDEGENKARPERAPSLRGSV